jgi:hypothetical protein
MTGSGGADKFNCGKGEDIIFDFNEAEGGDRASKNCENLN